MDEPTATCSSCGTRVLAATARRTGGVCMPCHKGTRAKTDTKGSLAEHVASHPPRCLDGFQVASTVADPKTVRFRLAAPSGNAAGRLYGHDLSRLIPEYKGPLQFVSPLSVQWSDAGLRQQLLDTDVHGYHGEIGSSATVRGTGEPVAFACASCGANVFTFEAEFHYWDETIDDWKEDPQLAAQDYFNVFALRASCTTCGTTSEASGLDL